MSKMKQYRQQHADIIAAALELERHLDAGRLLTDTSHAKKLLASLAEKMTLHLAAENNHLYPDLARSSNEALRRTAAKFAQDMAPIAKTFTSYVAGWPTPSAIKGDPTAFVAETRNILALLKARLKRENQELYSLADSA